MEQQTYISLRNINKIYQNKVHAVHDFNLDIAKHEFIVFVGPSGCGKSTTLRMVAGLEDITYGDLFIDGSLSNNLIPRDRDIAMVFQSYALYPHMNVYNNLAFGLKMRKVREEIVDKDGNPVLGIDTKTIKELKKDLKHIDSDIFKVAKTIEKNSTNKDPDAIKAIEELKNLENTLQDEKIKKTKQLEFYSNNEVPMYKLRKYTKKEIDDKVRSAAQTLEIEEYLMSKPRELSGGQRQRVALGRAIVRKAKVFLMDEPLSNLDAKLRVTMRSEIIKLHKNIDATTIYVTHDQTEAMTMADRIVVMKDGYVQQIGTPEEIYNNPSNTFVATFIGSPAMNISTVEYKSGTLVFPDKTTLKLEQLQARRIKDFYKNKIDTLTKNIEELTVMLNEFNDSTKESKRKTLKIENIENALTELKSNLDTYNNMMKSSNYEISFGLRPEEIKLAERNTDSCFELEVTIPELLGNEYFIHGNCMGMTLSAKISTKKKITEKEVLKVRFDLNAIHLFDIISKEAIL